MSHGGGAAGSASGDEAVGLAQGAVHPIPGALQAAKQAHPARRDPCQGHAGNTPVAPSVNVEVFENVNSDVPTCSL